jgi:NADH:quinone reductase (non-electrogenic)
MKTRITELLGIRHPIMQGGMHHVGYAELASAVSNAGGLGIITGLTQKTPELLAKEIARCREMTDQPFGVNLTFLPAFTAPPYPEYIRSIIEGGVKWRGRCAQLILLPRAAEELKIPFLASGGMADGRSLVAALAMGADGINMGTRFIATQEAPVHEKVKQAIVAASELDTTLIMRSIRNTERVLMNEGVKRVQAIEREKGAALSINDIMEHVAGVYPKVMNDGDLDAGAWSCGMVAGLIHDVPTCQALIDRIMLQAEQLIRQRLALSLN